jgi:hypothetical protein
LKKVLSDTELWGADLSAVPGFEEGVKKYL